MNLRTNNQSGFTLVELLIVIVVIAILAAISIVAYTGVQDRARNSAAVNTANQVAQKANAYHAVQGRYPATAADFANANVREAALEGIDVTIEAAGTAIPTVPSTSDWTNGTRVVYRATDANGSGYHVYYRDSNSPAGQPATGVPVNVNRISR